MPRARLAVTAGISAVIGAGIFFIVGFILHIFNFALPAAPSNPNDSPVTVRGGSVITLGGSWDCSQSSTYCVGTLTESAELLSLDGVDPRGSANNYNTPQHVPLPESGNWKIAFTYRLADGIQDDPNKVLTLCTSDSNCSGLPSGSATNKLYLVSDGNGTLTPITRDRAGVRYDLKEACTAEVPMPGPVPGPIPSPTPSPTPNPTPGPAPGPVFESKCNHIHTVTVFTQKDPSGKAYHCVDGACTISIGK